MTEISVWEIQRHLHDWNWQEEVCISTVKNARRKLDWVRTATRHGQLIRHINKAARLAFCMRMVENRETFDTAIVMDECAIFMEDQLASSFYWRREEDPAKKWPRPKHPNKVHVWAGVCRQGRTRPKIFHGIMRKEFFTDEILRNYLVPFIHEAYPDGNCKLVQEKDPKHSSRYARACLERKGINWFRTLTESPDIKPIEHMWAHMKWFSHRVNVLN